MKDYYIYNDIEEKRYEDKVHVGEICKKFGGGGHAGAAGFRTKKLPFVPKR